MAINAILWILRTGAPSRDLPRAYGSWKTVYGRWVSAVIPRRQGQGRGRHFDRQAYRQRNRMERLINRLKQFWRIATRNEKRAANYLAMLTLAAILLWL